MPLTKAKVCDYIKTRIATNRLQERLKAHATYYDNVVHTYFKKRKELLNQHGWKVEEFESVRDHINATMSAMDMADDLAKGEKNHQEEIKKIKQNKYLNEEQKSQMIKAINMTRDQQRSQFIEPTKADWPAVKPYREKLQQLADWVAGNIPNPPAIE